MARKRNIVTQLAFGPLVQPVFAFTCNHFANGLDLYQQIVLLVATLIAAAYIPVRALIATRSTREVLHRCNSFAVATTMSTWVIADAEIVASELVFALLAPDVTVVPELLALETVGELIHG